MSEKVFEEIARAGEILQSAKVPTKGRLAYLDGELVDCDTGEKIPERNESEEQ